MTSLSMVSLLRLHKHLDDFVCDRGQITPSEFEQANHEGKAPDEMRQVARHESLVDRRLCLVTDDAHPIILSYEQVA